GEGALELARLIDLDKLYADVERPGRSLHGLNRASRRRPTEDRDARGLRYRLPEELEGFPVEPFAVLQGNPGDISARSSQAGHDTALHWIAHRADDDRDRGACPLGGERGGGSAGDDHIDLEPDQLGH